MTAVLTPGIHQVSSSKPPHLIAMPLIANSKIIPRSGQTNSDGAMLPFLTETGIPIYIPACLKLLFSSPLHPITRTSDTYKSPLPLRPASEQYILPLSHHLVYLKHAHQHKFLCYTSSLLCPHHSPFLSTVLTENTSQFLLSFPRSDHYRFEQLLRT